MKINSAAPANIIAGDKQIPAHLDVKKPQTSISSGEKCFTPAPGEIVSIKRMPGSTCVDLPQLFSNSDTIIDNTLSQASQKRMGAQSRALSEFHVNIRNMTPGQLDEMKDSLVSRMGSDKTSQWERNLLEKMYEVTDAVAENRQVPHMDNPFDGGGVRPMPGKPDGLLEKLRDLDFLAEKN